MFCTNIISEFESFDGEEPDVLVREVLLDLEKSINLILWIVDLQLRGEVEEDDFNNLFGSYEYRFEQNLNRMYKILEIAREIKPMKKEYTEAKLRLAELELKKKIGDLSDEEYNVKASAYQWDIDKYEKMMVKRKSEVSLIENLNHIMTEQEILEMKRVTEKIRKNVAEQLNDGTLNKELGNRIEKILEEILSTPKNES